MPAKPGNKLLDQEIDEKSMARQFMVTRLWRGIEHHGNHWRQKTFSEQVIQDCRCRNKLKVGRPIKQEEEPIRLGARFVPGGSIDPGPATVPQHMTVDMMQLQLPLWHTRARHNPGLKRGSGQFKRRHMYFTTPGIFLIPGEKKRPGIERVTPAGGQPFLHVIDAPRKECIIRGEAIDGTSIRAHNVGFVPEICIQHAAHLVLGNVPSD